MAVNKTRNNKRIYYDETRNQRRLEHHQLDASERLVAPTPRLKSEAAAGRMDIIQVKKLLASLTAALLVCFLPIGCRRAKPELSSPGDGRQAKLNNCYSLLHELLNNEKDVSMLRFIKREHSDVKDLIKKVAATSGAESEALEEFAKKDPLIDLSVSQLPSGEIATRAAIASTEKSELLKQSGDEFELTLLLTQTEALTYAWHLALVASENDPQPDRARALGGVSDDMKNLYQEVFALLLSKTKSSATNQSATGDR